MRRMLKKIGKRNRYLYGIAVRLYGLFPKKSINITGDGNIFRNDGVLINVKVDVVGDNNVIRIFTGSKLSNVYINILGSNHELIIMQDCTYKGGVIWIEDRNGAVSIGKKTSVQQAMLVVTEPDKRITIGENCMFSAGITARTGDSHSIIDLQTNKRINYAQNITIGNHVWIGQNAAILKGVEIGDNSIVALNAVVTKNVPENSIVAGAPAKVIKTGINWRSERI